MWAEASGPRLNETTEGQKMTNCNGSVETEIDYAGVAIDAIRKVASKDARMAEAQLIVGEALVSAHGPVEMRRAIMRLANVLGVERG